MQDARNGVEPDCVTPVYKLLRYTMSPHLEDFLNSSDQARVRSGLDGVSYEKL